MVRTMKLAENDEFEAYDSISKNQQYFKNQVRVIPEELQNGAYIKRTIRKAVNDDSEVCDSISQLGHVLGFIGLRENFTVRAPNYCCHDKHHRTRLKRSIRGVSEHF